MLPKFKWNARSSLPTGSRSGRWQQRGTLASTTPTGGSLQQDSAASLLGHAWQRALGKRRKVRCFKKFWDDSGVFGAVLFTRFCFTLTSCSKRNIYMIEKLLQLFVILWVWINYENRHSDVLGHVLFSPSESMCAFWSTLSDYVSVLVGKKKLFLILPLQNCSLWSL